MVEKTCDNCGLGKTMMDMSKKEPFDCKICTPTITTPSRWRPIRELPRSI